MPKNRNPSRFWAYEEAQEGQPAVLRLDGPIDTETWWGDEVTPAMFRQELEAHPGDIEVYINSPGGDVIAATQIYTMLVEHKGSVTVKIEGLAASAASVVAMAGTTVRMAPTAYMMIHNAWSIAIGNKHAMEHEAAVLDEIDAGIRDAYRIKTGLRDAKLKQLMEDETWMSARTCIDLGFADGYIGAVEPDEEEPDEPEESDTDDPDEDDPDNIEHNDRKVANLEGSQVCPDGQTADGSNHRFEAPRRAVARLTQFPAVAYSGRRQAASLRKLLRDEEVLASVNREALTKLLGEGPRRGQVFGDSSEEIEAKLDEDDEAPQSDPADALQRMRLRLMSL